LHAIQLLLHRVSFEGETIKNCRALFDMAGAVRLLSILISQRATSGVFIVGGSVGVIDLDQLCHLFTSNTSVHHQSRERMKNVENPGTGLLPGMELRLCD
jgi:hypothetical protein